MATALYKSTISLIKDERHVHWISPLLIFADTLLCALIILKIPYTEIDWRAYMQQVEQYVDGELDYIKLYGGTGPLVYPALHVYIYRMLYAITDKGRDIRLAQYIFGFVYLVTLTIVMACYRRCKAPAYILPMLIMSKRLHSIFVLRLFNDCFAVMMLFIAIFLLQKRYWASGIFAYSLGLGIKMTMLLSLPAVAIIVFAAAGPRKALRHAAIIGQQQFVLGLPFLLVNARGYVSRAFELSRAFLFKWTVNWRFVNEDVFLSKQFAAALLSCHATLLIGFLIRWLQPLQMTPNTALRSVLYPPSPQRQKEISSRVTPIFVMTTMLTANAIGLLCARSLHYQFYALIAWSTPFLLWRAGLHPVLQYAVWGMQEVAWNVYPSTRLSSAVVVGCLVTTVACGWSSSDQARLVVQQTKHSKSA